MKDSMPDCFGVLDQVFPMMSDGLRHSPERCTACDQRAVCLKTAVTWKHQIVMAEERLDRTYRAGGMSFLERWSRRKMLFNLRTGKNRGRIKDRDDGTGAHETKHSGR